jgi:hypothetical protein
VKRDLFDRKLSPFVQPAPSADAAAWLGSHLLPWGEKEGTKVCSVVPRGFQAYARVLHPAFGPPPRRKQFRWQEIGEQLGHVVHAETQWESLEELIAETGKEAPWHETPLVGRCPSQVIVPLSEDLQRYTETPNEISFAMWIGFTDVRSLIRQAPHVVLPGREYALLTGPLTAAPWIIETPYGMPSSPSLWWPADRSWCVATEVDFRWTYVGGTDECVTSLVMDSRLEVLRTVPAHRGDIESDWPRNAVES